MADQLDQRRHRQPQQSQPRSLNQIEIKGVAVAAAGVALAAGTVTCEVYAKRFTKIPGVGTLVKTACGYVGLTKVVGLMKSIAAHTAAYYTHTCYQYGFGAGQMSWKVVGTSQCVSPAQSWQIA
ncbi:hypothetical protein [Pengzhenrongella sicca]|uniref:Uncharacterized protein n=1 Tax=Pengzhenrongella sicca TaxID=2819238 RepID=A0A8A4ZC56_9MICO|nr:hypothetical protein [Pengzhenrongella sicca]QTE28453.1 hypothetical protein J4E96_13860 [Pengzhenrongella sicca]